MIKQDRWGRQSAVWGALGLLLATGFVAGGHVVAKPKAGVVEAVSITVEARSIAAFDKRHPEQKTFGKLEWRGGLVLTSPSASFGGWSALAIDPDGRRLLAISDTGVWLTGELDLDGGRPAGIRGAKLGPLVNADGSPLGHGDDDSEAVTVMAGSLAEGEVLISFERHHRIGRFPVSKAGVGAPVEFLGLPSEAAQLEWNLSLESVCMLKGGPFAGSVVTLAERFPSKDDQHTGWMRKPGAKSWDSLRIAKIDGFDLTDCAGLPDGSLLVLERRYRMRDLLEGPKMRLRRLEPAELASGKLMTGETLIEADSDVEIDNMEGLAVVQGAMGEAIITMISDDNFNHAVQRTVLLQFALPARQAAAK
jgi:hypothetical protein